MTQLFLALVAILSPGDAPLEDAIRLAIQNPTRYLETHENTGGRLTTSKNPAADPKLPWLALADEMIARHLAVELDWKIDREDLLWNLNELRNYKMLPEKARASVSEIQRKDNLTVNWLRAAAAQVAAEHVVIAVMDIDSDSYITMLLKQSDYEHVTGLAEQLGYKLKDIRKYDPNQ